MLRLVETLFIQELQPSTSAIIRFRAIRENTVQTVIVHPIEIKSYLQGKADALLAEASQNRRV